MMLSFVLSATWLLTFSSIVCLNRSDQCLLIVLIDGVRWDYIKDKSLKGFANLAKNGVKAEYVRPIYPSNSYPNWYAITTGLYAESHGIVDNFIYDQKHQDYFLMAPDKDVFKEHWWNDAEPLWITAEKNGIKTFMYNWVGCEVKIRGKTASFCTRYRPLTFWKTINTDTQAAIFNILDQFEENTTRLGLVYYEPVDANGHQFGPNSYLTREAVKRIDSILNNVQREIESRELEHKVNIAIVADHGMTSKRIFRTRTISLDDVISPDDIRVMLNVHYNSMIWPMKGKEDLVYQKLKNANKRGLKVYRKEELPEKFHYQHHRLIAPIVLLAEKNYNILPLRVPSKVQPYYPFAFLTTYLQPGTHGFDPYSDEMTDMRTIFLARGPSFKKGYLAPPVEMVDHYQTFCYALGIQPLPNNGSWERVKDILQ